MYPHPSRLALCLFTALCLVSTAGCPKSKRRTLVPSVPTSGDASARARFHEAKSHFERDGHDNAAEFEAIAEAFPDDPVAPYALLYAGMAAVKSRDYDKAVSHLDALDDRPGVAEGLRVRARLFLGIAHNYRGGYDLAVPHLRAGERAIENDAERGEWLAAMAEALGRSPRPLDALSYYDRWYEVATAAEQAFILARLRAVVDQAPAADARAAYDAADPRDTPSAVVLGMRVAADLDAGGSSEEGSPGEARPEEARKIRAEIAAAREALGLWDAQGSGRGGDPDQVGAVLPLTGRSARRGELALRGLALASGTFPEARGADMLPFFVSARDTASTPAGAAQAVDDSAGEDVIALIGPINGHSVDQAAARAHSLGVPLISLNPRSGRRIKELSRFVFHILHSAEDRAEALARHAHAQGATSFAILRPQNGYGRVVSQVFRDEVERLGGQVVAEAAYEARETSFGDVIAELGGSWDAVFVPDLATRLALIAPALAAADLRVQPLEQVAGADASRSSSEPGRDIGLLSTAEFVSARYVRSAGRYSVGAVLAPGFYADRDDPVIRDFVDRYELAFGQEPTAVDAYAYDAALVVRAAIAGGAQSRGEVADAMADAQVTGLTGTIRFTDSHRRADDGLLFVVASDGDEEAIRAVRD